MNLKLRRRTCFVSSFQYKREMSRILLLSLALIFLALKLFAQEGVKVDERKPIKSERHPAILICPGPELGEDILKQLDSVNAEAFKDWRIEFSVPEITDPKDSKEDAKNEEKKVKKVSIQLFQKTPDEWIVRRTTTDSNGEVALKDFDTKEDREAWISLLKLNSPTEIKKEDGSSFKIDWLAPATLGYCRSNRRTSFTRGMQGAIGSPILKLIAADHVVRIFSPNETSLGRLLLIEANIRDEMTEVCVYQEAADSSRQLEVAHNLSIGAPKIKEKLDTWKGISHRLLEGTIKVPDTNKRHSK